MLLAPAAAISMYDGPKIRIFKSNENAIHEHERKYISTIKLHQTEIDEMKASKPTVDVEEMRHRINALQIQADKSKQLADSNIRIVKKKNKGVVSHTESQFEA